MSWFIWYLISAFVVWVIYIRFFSSLEKADEGGEMGASLGFCLLWPIALVVVTLIVGYRTLFRLLRTSRIQRRKEEDEVENMLKKGPKL